MSAEMSSSVLPSQFVVITVITAPFLALLSLIIGLASVGASFGIRRMYVRALLKIFEYATDIKQQKTKDCFELLGEGNKSQLECKKDLARLKRLRLESFMLHPPQRNNSEDSLASLTDVDLDELDKHLSAQSAQATAALTSDVDRDADNNKSGVTRRRQNVSENGDDAAAAAASVENSNEQPGSTAAAAATAVQFDSNGGDSSADEESTSRARSISDLKRDFQLGDIMEFVHNGLEAIVDDAVTKRFTTEELTVWNLLSRTNQQYEYVSFRVTVLWILGMLLRYLILFPIRFLLFIFTCFYTFVSTYFIGHVADGRFKRTLNWYGNIILHRMLSRVFSAIITFHNRENKPAQGSICVANHTSPIDVILLSTDQCYSMIGQTHGGFMGMMQRAFSRSGLHIWFDRSQARDRGLVASRMREHVHDKSNMPILIFPEGTCINNTSVMMFKKGCFEVDTTIYPVAIKYDPRFGDAFWNSGKHSMLQYLMLMMTSWAIVADVYYLPPMTKQEGEDAAHFASRVKTEIVKKGSFVDLHWDGMLKRTAPKLDLMYEQQQKYVSQLKLE